MDAKDRLIVALDFPSRQAAMHLVDRLDGQVSWFKVGLELYLAEGRSMVDSLCARGMHVFLDLKLHDIPNTVAAAVRVAGSGGAELLTVHASGGPAMLAAAAEAASSQLRLLAVTVLTSTDTHTLAETGVPDAPEAQVVRLAALAIAAGVDGLVCSAQEVQKLRSAAARDALLVTPGIRPTTAQADDQRRTATAAEALRYGADMLVVGRPITRATDPAAAAEQLLNEMHSVQAQSRT